MRGYGLAAGATVTVGVRPEHAASGSGEVALDPRVDAVEQLGAVSLGYCPLQGGEKVSVQAPGQVAQRVGDTARVAFAAASAHVFRQTDGEPVVARVQ